MEQSGSSLFDARHAALSLLAAHNEAEGASSPGLQSMLKAVRTHLDMDLAFISEFSDGRRFFRDVDARTGSSTVTTGDSDPLDEAYCYAMATGALPELVNDLAISCEGKLINSRHKNLIRSHLSVPILLDDGRCYGALCCTSAQPDHSLNTRDLKVLRVFADIAGRQIDSDARAQGITIEIKKRIEAALSGELLQTLYQPIFKLADQRVIGFETLSHFESQPDRAPDLWFAEAATVGRGSELEAMVVRTALRDLARLPPLAYVTVNVSPNTILDGTLGTVLAGWPLERVVLEVTEHAVIDHYQEIATIVRPLRERGMRIAVDDAGAGYASFKHILSLAPDIIKLDVSIIRNIDSDRARFSLAAALLRFAEETGSRLIAEGVETAAELTTLSALGVEYAQGFLLGRPIPLEDVTNEGDRNEVVREH